MPISGREAAPSNSTAWPTVAVMSSPATAVSGSLRPTLTEVVWTADFRPSLTARRTV